MTELPSGTVTFLFTDIERSTEHLTAMGNDTYADALDTHRRVLREAFKMHDGHEIATEGDSFFVAFARARDAVDAAIAGQRSLAEHPLRSRMGIHTGEALVRGGGYVGHDVHKAKRISDAGHGGQVLLSQTTADLVGRSALVDLGPHRLKDLGEPQRIFQVGDGTFPSLRSLESFRHSLPRQRSSFIGREREIAQISELLEKNQLVTIHGVGGCGKTRLAVQVGAEMLHEFPDGVFFADLAPISDDDGIVHSVADAVGIPLGGPVGTIPTAVSDDLVLRYMSERTSLLILDNCEHLLDGCAALADRLLAHCPRLSILATSREALQVDGEQAWRLPSLSLPDDPASMAQSEAVSLFASRARAASGSFALTPAEAPAVAEICRRLDGIPLAIEFAAARTTHLSPKQIAQKLDDRFRLLTGGRRQIQRQLTLQATLDWSYDLLDEPERILLRRLAVFPSDFSLEAAEGICSDDDLKASEIFEVLASLVAKSLLDTEPARDVIRYRLLETVRAYAADRLSMAGEAQLVRDRYSNWYLAWLEGYDWDEIFGYAMVPRLLAEGVNLRAAVEWSASSGNLEHVGRLSARFLTVITGLAGLGPEVRVWSRSALDAAMELDPSVRAACLLGSVFGSFAWDSERTDVMQEIIDMGDEISPAIRAFTLSQRGILDGIAGAFARDEDRMERSRQSQRDALALAAHLRPDFRLVIEVSNGMNELDLLNVDGAVEALEQASRTESSLPEIAGDVGGVAVSFYLSAALYAAGQHGRAGETMQVAIKKAQTTGLDLANARIVFSAAASALATVDRSSAVELLTGTIDEIRRAQLPLVLEDWVSGAAGVLALSKDSERAARLLSWVRSRTLDRGVPSTSPAQYVVNRYNVNLVREALGHEQAQQCREEGRALSEDDAVAMSLEGLHAL